MLDTLTRRFFKYELGQKVAVFGMAGVLEARRSHGRDERPEYRVAYDKGGYSGWLAEDSVTAMQSGHSTHSNGQEDPFGQHVAQEPITIQEELGRR